jgi:hypothetical protein
MPKYLDYKNRDDGRVMVPMLEFAVGSLSLSRKQALIELGFPEEEVDRLMEERLAEDLVEEPSIPHELGLAVAKQYKEEVNG